MTAIQIAQEGKFDIAILDMLCLTGHATGSETAEANRQKTSAAVRVDLRRDGKIPCVDDPNRSAPNFIGFLIRSSQDHARRNGALRACDGVGLDRPRHKAMSQR